MASRVPRWKGAISKTPMGPFHTMVLADMMTRSFSARDSGPQSRPIRPSGIPPVENESTTANARVREKRTSGIRCVAHHSVLAELGGSHIIWAKDLA